MRSQSRTVVVQLKTSVTVTTARRIVGVAHRMLTQRHSGVTIVKTIVPTTVAAAVANWVGCSKTARAWATLAATAAAAVDATADVAVDATVDAVVVEPADDTNANCAKEQAIVVVRLHCRSPCRSQATVDAATIAAADAAADY